MIARWLLLTLFHLLYTRLAWMYDIAGWIASAGLWYRWTEQVLPFIEEGPVLEVGCGRGRLLRALSAHGHTAIGVDLSPQMARHARRSSGRPTIESDGRALPFPTGHFGTVVTTFPAPYILEPATHVEFARVVKPGGLWLWVDAPVFQVTARTLPSYLLTRLAWGEPDASGTGQTEWLLRNQGEGLWEVEVRCVTVGPSTVAVRIARRV